MSKNRDERYVERSGKEESIKRKRARREKNKSRNK